VNHQQEIAERLTDEDLSDLLQDRVLSAKASQVGGSHYASMAIQPFEYIHANGIGFAEGCVIKYVSRWRNKNGVEDLKKARHFLDLLIEAESAK
jgi:hypothetical protein